MAAFGNSYPGVYQPAWWYATTGTSTTTNIVSTWQDFAEQQPKAAPVAPVKPRTAVEWLRGRVQEMCDLAGLADAV
jgi:hypothetical protein